MKTNTIKWKIFKYNIIVIIMLIALVTIIFNVAIQLYIENDIVGQLTKISSRTEDTALRRGPDFFPGGDKMPPPKDNKSPDLHFPSMSGSNDNNDLYRFYFMLDRSLREPLSVLNADYILLDSSKQVVSPFPDESLKTSKELLSQVTEEINKLKDNNKEEYLNVRISGIDYIEIIKPVSEKNTFGLGWIVIYSSLQKVNQLKWGINILLFVILIFSALIIVIFSSVISKKISAPFSSLNHHIRSIAERNFGTKIYMPVDDELRELVNNINTMSEKLETYDLAQKTFLQNASHEFRTPLMSIQSYAEGIKYEVVDTKTAANIIIDESKRMTHLVEDLLYLSRLETIEENYNLNDLDINDLIKSCIDRINGIALQSNIKIVFIEPKGVGHINADEEKLSRAFTNILSNCIRYAKNTVSISLTLNGPDRLKIVISDDGPGFELGELPKIFDRFFMGKNGKSGLGLTISKNVIEKHNGQISASNVTTGGAMFIIDLPLNKS